MRHRRIAVLLSIAAGFAAACGSADDMGASQTTAQALGASEHVSLPLQEFIQAQGNHDVWYPPEPALFAWTGRPPEYPRMGWVDYVGAADRWIVENGGTALGTTVSGTFTRRSVDTGRYEYSVSVHAKNALAWCVRAFDDDGNWEGVTLLFGAHADQVLAGATPALGEIHFKATWRQNKGTPIADINLAANWGDPYSPAGWEMIETDARATAWGPLHAAAGLGQEGTPGKMVISQTDSNAEAYGHGHGNADGYPAEVMDLHAVGKK